MKSYISADKIILNVDIKPLFYKKILVNVEFHRPFLYIYPDFFKTKNKGIKFSFLNFNRILFKDLNLVYLDFENEIRLQNSFCYVRKKDKDFEVNFKSTDHFYLNRKLNIKMRGSLFGSFSGNEKMIKFNNLKFLSDGLSYDLTGNIFNLQHPRIEFSGKGILLKKFFSENLKALPFSGKAQVEIKGTVERQNLNLRGNLIFHPDIIGISKDISLKGDFDITRRGFSEIKFFIEKEGKRRGGGRIYLNKKKLFVDLKKFEIETLSEVLKTEYFDNYTLDFNGLGYGNNLEGKMNFFKKSENGAELQGDIKLKFDRNKVNFSSKNLKLNSLMLNGEGKVYYDGGFSVKVSLETTDLESLNNFVQKNYKVNTKLESVSGEGYLNINIFGKRWNPQFNGNFYFKNVKTLNTSFGEVKGDVEGQKRALKMKGFVQGDFIDGKWETEMERERNYLRVDFQRIDLRGLEKIYKKKLDLKGRPSGEVLMINENGKVSIESVIKGDNIYIHDKKIDKISGEFNYKNDLIDFSSVYVKSGNGIIKGDGKINFKDNFYSLNISGDSIELSSFLPDLSGKGSFLLKGKGELGRDPVIFTGRIEGVSINKKEFRNGKIRAEILLNRDLINSNVLINFKNSQIESTVTSVISLNVLKKEIFGDFRLSSNDFQFFIPYKIKDSEMELLGQISGNLKNPELRYYINLKGESFFIPYFSYDFKNYSAYLTKEGNIIKLKSSSATMGNGRVTGFGEIYPDGMRIKSAQININGKDMQMAIIERARGVFDLNMKIKKEENIITFDGDIYFYKLSWKREIGEKIVFSSGSPSSSFNPGSINLNIRMKADRDAWMENSLGKVEVKASLRVSGTSENPSLTGEITGIRGELNLADRKFRLINGRVNFNNPYKIDPVLDIQSEAFIKDYRVLFIIKGNASKPVPQLVSYPSLSPQDTLALVSLGEIYRRPFYRIESQVGTASLISMELSEMIKSRAKKMFGVDKFRIDPFLLGSSSNPSFRLTVGKKISKDLFIIYSTNLSTQQEEIIFAEFQLSNDVSLIGMKNEEGRFGFDIKLRKRF
ncbi:MAG: translocation/assembly module TamB domain-containing protein [Acidobacteriota bacterium]